MSPVIFFVEGNIGSGKSTFLKNLQSHFSNDQQTGLFKTSQFLQEPVDIWKNTIDSNGASILDHFYQDMERFCYTFQSFAFISRIKQLDSIDNATTCVFIERSVHCDRNVFASACHDSGMMTDIEWQIYTTWFDWMETKYRCIFNSARYIYLKCSPSTALERIGRRGRSEETTISIDYLQTLHRKHEEWLCAPDTAAIVIDAEQNLHDPKILSTMINQIVANTAIAPDIYKNIDWDQLTGLAVKAATPSQHASIKLI